MIEYALKAVLRAAFCGAATIALCAAAIVIGAR